MEFHGDRLCLVVVRVTCDWSWLGMGMVRDGMSISTDMGSFVLWIFFTYPCDDLAKFDEERKGRKKNGGV